MITRAKHGIHKPKVYPSEFKLYVVNQQSSHVEPKSVQEALKSKDWVSAMEEEISALYKNNTWDLVPYSSSYNVVGNKWVFKIKLNEDGSF